MAEIKDLVYLEECSQRKLKRAKQNQVKKRVMQAVKVKVNLTPVKVKVNLIQVKRKAIQEARAKVNQNLVRKRVLQVRVKATVKRVKNRQSQKAMILQVLPKKIARVVRNQNLSLNPKIAKVAVLVKAKNRLQFQRQVLPYILQQMTQLASL